MFIKAILPAIALFSTSLLFFSGSAMSSEQPKNEKPKNKVCKLAQKIEIENPAGFQERQTVGKVYAFAGDVVMVDVGNGQTKHLYLSRQERAHIGQIVGRNVVITDIFCKRVSLAAPKVNVVQQRIETPKIETPPPVEQPVTPPPVEQPVTPPPVEQPVTPPPLEQPVPVEVPKKIIPQTW
jgi:hypothetical protein